MNANPKCNANSDKDFKELRICKGERLEIRLFLIYIFNNYSH